MNLNKNNQDAIVPLRVGAFSKSPEFLATLRTALEGQSGIKLALNQGGIEVLGKLAQAELPDVLIAQEFQKSQDHLKLLSQFTLAHPGVTVVLSCHAKDPDLMVQALRAGVKEFLFEPFVEGEIEALIRRLGVRRTVQAGGQQGEVVAFIPCKGGSGSTFLATNLAHALAAKQQKRVLLIDLNLQFGDASFFLMDRAPATTLAGVCGSFSRLDRSFLASAVAKLPSGLHLLAAPENAVDAELVKPEHIESIIALARAQYDFIVLDMGRNLDAVSLKALDLADHVYPVLQLSLPYVRDARRMKEVFHSLGYRENVNYSENKIRWIINRSGGEGDLPVSDVDRVIGPAFWTVPNDHKHVGEAVNQGVPIIEIAPHSASSKSLVRWAETLANTESLEGKARKNWFSFLRGSEK